jgi:hypothetical protein
MPDKPKIPSYEEIERELGLDKMSFMSEMVRPDAEEEREDEGTVPTQSRNSAGFTPEEQKIIDLLEWSGGRKLTPQEIHLSLEQARQIGEL